MFLERLVPNAEINLSEVFRDDVVDQLEHIGGVPPRIPLLSKMKS